MSTQLSRTRAVAVPALLGIVALLVSSCVAPAAAPFYGIHFSTPSVGYVGQTYKLTATATSKLPVQLTLDATSNGCTLNGSTTGAIVSYDALGTCVINANEPGDATHAASKQVQRKISIVPCPPLNGGLWTTTVLGKSFSGVINVAGDTFSGSVDLTALGVPGLTVFAFTGTVACQIASMTIGTTTITGVLSPDGSTLSANYQGIAIVLHAPVTPA